MQSRIRTAAPALIKAAITRARRGWSNMSQDEKLEALRSDVNDALDLVEEHEEEITQLKRVIASLSESLEEVRQHMS
jgi:chromosome segregation ATPase